MPKVERCKSKKSYNKNLHKVETYSSNRKKSLKLDDYNNLKHTINSLNKKHLFETVDRRSTGSPNNDRRGSHSKRKLNRENVSPDNYNSCSSLKQA